VDLQLIATASRPGELSVLICRFSLSGWVFGEGASMLMRNDHDGPGVVPGRYPGEAIQLHDGPTPESVAYKEQRAVTDALAGRICAAAAEAAHSTYTLVELLGEFDATNAIRFWTGFKSLAHWLSWCCSMTPGVAREHVRVAKALRRMPTIAGLFREARLSYSKVRELTRVVDVVDEQRLAELALTATASQLARMISGFRSADGLRSNSKPNAGCCGMSVTTAWSRSGLGCPRRRLPCCWRRWLRRRISSGHPHPNPTHAVLRGNRPHRVLVCTAMLMRCWMWPAASSTPHLRIVPVRTAPWWWCTSRPNSWQGTFPLQQRTATKMRQQGQPRKTFPRQRHRRLRCVT
jgi:hypothetical protein